MYAVGRIGSYISRGVYTVSGPFHPFGGAVDIIVVEQPDGSFKSSPWYVRFGKFQGVLKSKEKVVSICVNGVEADFNMYLDSKGEAFFLREVDGEEGEALLYPSSSGDETDGLSRVRTPTKSKSCNFDSDNLNSDDLIDAATNGKILTRSASRRARILGLVFGRRSKKEGSFSEGEGEMGTVELTSLERAEIAADLLEVKWSTNLSSSRSRKNMQVSNEQTQVDSSVHHEGENRTDHFMLHDETGSHTEQMASSSRCSSATLASSVEEASVKIACIGTMELDAQTSTSGELIVENRVCDENDVAFPGCGVYEESESDRVQSCANCETSESSIVGLGASTEQTQETLYLASEGNGGVYVHMESLHVTAELPSKDTDVNQAKHIELEKEQVEVSEDHSNQLTPALCVLESNETDLGLHQVTGVNQAEHIELEKEQVEVSEDHPDQLTPALCVLELNERDLGLHQDTDVNQAEHIELEKEQVEVSGNHSDQLNPALCVLELNETDLGLHQDTDVNQAAHIELEKEQVEVSGNHSDQLTPALCVLELNETGLGLHQDTNVNQSKHIELEKEQVEVSEIHSNQLTPALCVLELNETDLGLHQDTNVNQSKHIELEKEQVEVSEIHSNQLTPALCVLKLNETDLGLHQDTNVNQSKHIELEKEQVEVSEIHSNQLTPAPCVLELNETDLEEHLIVPESYTQMVSVDPALRSSKEVEQKICTTSSVSPEVQVAENIRDGLHQSLESIGDSSKPYNDDVLKEVVRNSLSESSEEEQFFFSDLDEFKLREAQGVDSSSPDCVEKDDHSEFCAEGIEEVNQTVNTNDESFSSPDMFVQYNWSSPVSIPTSHKAAQDIGRLAESLPIMCSPTVNSGVHDHHRPLSHSLDLNSDSLKWKLLREDVSSCIKSDAEKEQQLAQEQPNIEDTQISQELKSSLSSSAVGDPSESIDSSGGTWRLWPFLFKRSRSRKAMQPTLSDTKNSDAEIASESTNGVDEVKIVCKAKVEEKMIRALTPTSEQLASLNLKEGSNIVTFTFSTAMLGKQQVDARIYLWKWNTRIVISDVDGTITKSDVLGQFMPLVGMDWSQTGVTHLFSAIKENGYQLLFLSARAISQAYITRQFLLNLKQDGKALPDGPVVISPDGLFPSLFREVIRRAPHEFKIACLEDIRALFPSDCNPFYAGFGNRDTDEISYLKVGIPRGKIFIINPKGQVAVNRRVHTKSYSSLHDLVHGMFPPATSSEQEDFNSWNFWRLPPPDINF